MCLVEGNTDDAKKLQRAIIDVVVEWPSKIAITLTVVCKRINVPSLNIGTKIYTVSQKTVPVFE